MNARFAVTTDPLDERDAVRAIEAHGAGALVTFVGRVRARSRGRDVTRLDYEAYPEMALRVFEQIAAEVRERVRIVDVAIHHRIGALDVGETSVVIAVAAEHRDQAFDACRYAIDRLKQIAPIWKKEHGPDGSSWVEDRP